jgi:formylglycine-generating enzyme required for sulfatase activity
VFEWCNDWHTCSLGTTPATNPVGPLSGANRVVRGGSLSGDATYLLGAGREGAYDPARTSHTIGFRIARSQ